MSDDRLITVVTLNVAHARGVRGHQIFWPTSVVTNNLKKIGKYLFDVTPDLVGLQEIDTNSIWNGAFDHAKFISQQAEIPHVVVGEHMKRFRLRYGTGLLSRYDLDSIESKVLPTTATLPPKGYLFAEVCIRDQKIGVVSLHLDFARHKSRVRQIDILIERFREYSLPLIIMGDFNAQWADKNSAVKDLAHELGLHSHSENGNGLSTFPGAGKCWDWILGSSHFEFVEYRTDMDLLSDHRAVVARLRLKEDLNVA